MSPSEQTVMTQAELLRLSESRLRAVEATLANIGAPTHDAEGARLNANGRLVEWLAGRRGKGWTGPDPMRELQAAIDVMNGCRLDDQETIERLRKARNERDAQIAELEEEVEHLREVARLGPGHHGIEDAHRIALDALRKERLMPAKRIEFTVSDETWQRIEKARGDVPRAAWIKRAILKRLATAERKREPTKETS